MAATGYSAVIKSQVHCAKYYGGGLVIEWFKQFAKSSNAVVGIEFPEDGMCLAVRDILIGGLRLSTKIEADTSIVSLVTWEQALSRVVETQGLQGLDCNVVLPAKFYQILLVEAPDVPDAELREAVKWKVKDLIQSPLEESLIDVFALPDSANKSAKKMIYVVVAERAAVMSVIELVANVGMSLQTIDIEVMALRNLTRLKETERGAALVRLRPGSGDVSIYRDGNLYLSRHFKLQYSGGLLDEFPADALALEVQRSFDYFERQMGQVPPGVLYMCGEGVGPEKISDEFKRSLSVPIEFFDVRKELALDPEKFDEGLIQVCIGAIGAAYREEAA